MIYSSNGVDFSWELVIGNSPKPLFLAETLNERGKDGKKIIRKEHVGGMIFYAKRKRVNHFKKDHLWAQNYYGGLRWVL
jgi:hypothetical protein